MTGDIQMQSRLLSSMLFMAVVCIPTSAADWPRFRGPNGSGVSDATGLPVEFGLVKNLLWKADLPPGHSSPVVAGDHIFLTAYEKDKLLTICLDRKIGKILWQREITRARSAGLHPHNSPASPSPATDGENVYVFFQDFGLISYSADGREQWRMPLGPFRNVNGMGASPIVSHGLVLLVCDQDIGSFVVAVNKQTGEMRWRRDRTNTLAAGYSTPVVYEGSPEGPLLIAPAAFQMTAYRLDSGERVWWVNGFPAQPNASPIVGEHGAAKDTLYVSVQGATDLALASFSQLLTSLDKDKNGSLSPEEVNVKEDSLGGPAFSQVDLDGDGLLTEKEWNFVLEAVKTKDLLLAIRPGSGHGDLTQTKVLWRHQKGLPRVPSPILYQSVLYLLKEGGILTSMNPETGEVFKQARLKGALDDYFASPVAADGKLYAVSQTGHVVVLKAGRDWDILTVNDLGEECYATPAIANGNLLIRTRGGLYCFGKH
jgi:outer membrane protein assembly factor BamB